jgi:hypothetical protein
LNECKIVKRAVAIGWLLVFAGISRLNRQLKKRFAKKAKNLGNLYRVASLLATTDPYIKD